MIGASVYVLCALTSGACAFLLIRRYVKSRIPLLAWAAVCFALLFLNNVLLFTDLVLLPNVDLSLERAATGTLAVGALLAGILRGE